MSLDSKQLDPRLIEYAVKQQQLGSMTQPSAPTCVPGRGPVAMPMAAPGPGGGGGGYNRYREMTLEEMLLENRVVFLVGEINHVDAEAEWMSGDRASASATVEGELGTRSFDFTMVREHGLWKIDGLPDLHVQ